MSVVAPTIYPEVEDQAINERSITSFTCQATSEPVPTIIWYYNGALVNNETNMNKYSISQSSFNETTIINTLTIMNVESSDVGTYTCNATNVLSSDTSSGVLTVNGELLLLQCIINTYMLFNSGSKHYHASRRTTI